MPKVIEKIITHNTFIPLALVGTIVMAVVSVVWMSSTVNAKVEFLTAKDSPSRVEFNKLCDDVKDIKDGVQDINTFLRNK